MEAINLLGICYLNGLGIENSTPLQIEKNQKQAVELFTSISESYPEARYHLAWYYLYGKGVVPNFQQAKALCDKDPKSSHTENLLATLYEELYEKSDGGIAKNSEQAQVHYLQDQVYYLQAQMHYLKAIEAGHALAMYNYAELLDKIGKTEHDKRTVIFRQKSAAKLGYAPAQKTMSDYYFKGVQINGITILEQDLKKSFEYLKAAAEQGISYYQNDLGNCYYHGRGNAQKDFSQAIKYYRLAAEQGYGTAFSNLGFCYENGSGVEQDLTKAFDLYQQGANKDDSFANESLAICYAEGVGVKKDVPKAIDILKKRAHEHNDPKAQLRLGNIYRYGWHGVQKDEKTTV